MCYVYSGQFGVVVLFKLVYGNFIDGRFVELLSGEFFMNILLVDGCNIVQFFCLDVRDIDFVFDVVYCVVLVWGKILV